MIVLGAPVIVYDVNMKPVAVLENASGVGYEQRHNELWKAWFSLPANDPKSAECKPFRFVELWEDDDRVDLFYILPEDINKTADGPIKSYQCEHVMGTLLDDVLFQYHQVDGLTPEGTLNYILEKQTSNRWQIGTVDFVECYSYKWENENLLSALLSVPAIYSEEYVWTWDTSTTPWTLNLVRASSQVSAYILYHKNLDTIGKNEDPTGIITRIYGLGYGEGVNQLTIKDVNGGLPYLDADTLTTYGIKSYIHVDLSEENADMLKAKLAIILEANKNPRITYSVSAMELYQITKDSIDKFLCGALVYANDSETNMEFNARVKVRRKNDYTSDPGKIDLEIGNAVLTIADFNTDLSTRQRISETYAQGATNLDSHDFADNCDPDYPAVIRFFIPEEMVRINKMMLRYDVLPFRGYTKGAIASGKHAHLMFKDMDGGVWEGDSPSNWRSYMSEEAEHNHGLTNHAHGNAENTAQGSEYPAHKHDFNYPLYTMQARKSSILEDFYNVGLAVPATGGSPDGEDIWTWGTEDDHQHETIFGIILSTESPSEIVVAVDGTPISGLGLNETDVNIVPYLTKDSNGKVTRGVWHEIVITPNAIGRVVANVVTQMFVQSRGGGDY